MILLEGSVRPSGSILTPAVYKRCKQAVDQALLMEEAKDVYAPVLAMNEDGYVMPVLQSLRNAFDVKAALYTLEQYWSKRGHLRQFCTRAAYQDYVLSLPCDPVLKEAVDSWYRKTQDVLGTPAMSLHGDATLENVMMYEGRPAWIDPNPRPVPADIEVDLGKLLQTAFGYHDTTLGAVEAIGDFTRLSNARMDLCYYYFVTHLVRLWRYQPSQHVWAKAVALEVCQARVKVR